MIPPATRGQLPRDWWAGWARCYQWSDEWPRVRQQQEIARRERKIAERVKAVDNVAFPQNLR